METDREGRLSSILKPKRNFISPTSSFVDFSELTTEYYTEEGRTLAQLYNPHGERKINKPTTDFETCVHILKGSVGAGLLAMPKAFQNGGVAIGVAGTLLLGTLCVYAIDTLLKMQYIQCKRLQVPFLTYPRSVRIALLNGPSCLKCFACIAPPFVDFFLVFYQLGICTAYVIFIADSIQHVIESNIKNVNLDKRVYILMLVIPLILVNFIRNLKKLTPLSLISNILTIIALFCCFYFIFMVGPFSEDKVEMIADPETWPLFMGTVLFALEAIGVIIALEHNMKNPGNFLGKKGIFPWSLSFVLFLYLSVGLLGYLKYGPETKETIVASLPRRHWLTFTVEAVYAVCIFMSYPLQCFVSLEILWGNYLVHHIKDEKKECAIEYILRTVVVILTIIAALVIPYVDVMISLVGAFCISTLGIGLPFLIELCTLWPDELGCVNMIKDIAFILLGFLILILGTYVSIYSLIVK